MAVFLAIVAAIWGIGHLMKAPLGTRWIMTGFVYFVVVLAQFVLPADSGFRQVMGGTRGGWLLLGALVVAVWGYMALLRRLRLRQRAAPKAPSAKGTFSATELDRYARHIVLREIGGPGQKRLKGARVLVIGAGGLGSPALMYLAAAGVGTIGVIDDDVVDNSNLQRQVIHTDGRIDMPKVFSAATAMQAQNPHVTVRPYHQRLSADNAAALIGDYDLVLDGSDNFDTRYLVNETCVALKVPLISAALSQWEGQISLFDPAHGAPCYRCIFPRPPAAGLVPSCAEGGVLGPLTGVLGSMMAVEAVKEIAKAGDGLRGRMMIYDALYAESRVISLRPDPECPVCGGENISKK